MLNNAAGDDATNAAVRLVFVEALQTLSNGIAGAGVLKIRTMTATAANSLPRCLHCLLVCLAREDLIEWQRENVTQRTLEQFLGHIRRTVRIDSEDGRPAPGIV